MKGPQLKAPASASYIKGEIGGEELLVRRLARRSGDVIVERVKPDESEFLAQHFLAGADLAAIGQEDFGTGEIDSNANI
jgi:hypothetical protein